VCIGGIAVDRIYRLSHLPEPGSGTHILGMDTLGGGVEANVAAGLARLGVRVALISRVGDDADGRWVRADLESWDVDVSRVVALQGVDTDFCIVWVPPDGERLLACHNPCLRSMQLDDADRAMMSQASVLFVSSFVPLELLRETLEETQRIGVTVAFDLTDTFDDLGARGLGRDDFWRLLPQIDLLMTNHLALGSLMDMKKPEAAFGAFCRRAPEVSLAMTMGAQGAWLGCGGAQVYVDAFPVQVVDSTGAGDAFHAGLIYSLLLSGQLPGPASGEQTAGETSQKSPAGLVPLSAKGPNKEQGPEPVEGLHPSTSSGLRRAGTFASALAALNCVGPGARGGLATQDEVLKFLCDHRGVATE
jgi:sulfofructose kinase